MLNLKCIDASEVGTTNVIGTNPRKYVLVANKKKLREESHSSRKIFYKYNK